MHVSILQQLRYAVSLALNSIPFLFSSLLLVILDYLIQVQVCVLNAACWWLSLGFFLITLCFLLLLSFQGVTESLGWISDTLQEVLMGR